MTVISFDETQLTFGISPETLNRTYFSLLACGDKVNLERAAKLGDRVSGHYVQGHVDGTGTVISKTKDGDSLWIKVQLPDELMQVVEKGFVAVDGTSLTVCEVSRQEKWFTFMLVPYTQNKVIIPHTQIGGFVNIELDVMSKFAADSVKDVESRMTQKFENVFRRLDALETATHGSLREH